MSEKQFLLSISGREVTGDDLNTMGDSAGRADDRVLAEILRLARTENPTKAIMPYGFDRLDAANQQFSKGTVQPSGNADGSIYVFPFRAVVALPLPASLTDPNSSYRDVRSAVYAGTGGSEELAQPFALTANASGNARWDVVYAKVSCDVTTTVSRYMKDVTSGVVSVVSVPVNQYTKTEVFITAGTPSGSPALPAVPVDNIAGNIFYIPLAYVRVPNGFGSGSTVQNTDILEVAYTTMSARGTGVSTLEVASSQWSSTDGTNGLTAARAATWGSSGTRPTFFAAPTNIGCENLLVFLDLTSATSTNWSHQDGAIIDASRDWRNRYFLSFGQVMPSSNNFPHAGGSPIWINSQTGFVAAQGTNNGFRPTVGQSFYDDDSARRQVWYCDNTQDTSFFSTGVITVYVDGSDGRLKLHATGDPRVAVFLWLQCTAGPWSNK